MHVREKVGDSWDDWVGRREEIDGMMNGGVG